MLVIVKDGHLLLANQIAVAITTLVHNSFRLVMYYSINLIESSIACEYHQVDEQHTFLSQAAGSAYYTKLICG